MSARWAKVLSDLRNNKARSALVALSIAVGVLAVGVVATSYGLVKRDTAADYDTVNPHTARVFADEFDDAVAITQYLTGRKRCHGVNGMGRFEASQAPKGRTAWSANTPCWSRTIRKAHASG